MVKRVSQGQHFLACLLLAVGSSLFVRPTPVRAQFYPPIPGETIRIQVVREVARARGLPPRWEGVFLMIQQETLVGRDPRRGGIVVPLDALETIDVSRRRPAGYAFVRGTIAGAVFGGAVYVFLRILCRDTCDGGGFDSAELPSLATGLGVGLLVGGQGPGNRWYRIPVPAPQPGRRLGR